MELERIQAELRVRPPAEAADLGLLLLRRLARPALLAWLAFVLPLQLLVIGVCSIGADAWVFLALWWLKPVYDRAFGVVLGQGLFGEAPAGGALLRALWAHGRRGLVGDLLWRRFSIARTTVAPVSLLEHLSGSTASQRRRVLVHGQGGYLTMVLTGCSMVEWACYGGLVVGANWMMPDDSGWSPADLLEEGGQTASTYWTLVTYLLSLGVAEAVFVAMGFGLYINRRTMIEGWDVELTFRRMAARLNAGGASLALLLACVSWVSLLGPTGVHAQPVPSAIESLVSYEPGPQDGRDAGGQDVALDARVRPLNQQAVGGGVAGEAIEGPVEEDFEFSEGAAVDAYRLEVPTVGNGQLARDAMQTVLARPELERKHVQESWELRDQDGGPDEGDDRPHSTPLWLARLASAFAQGAEAVLWSVALLALLGLGYVVMGAMTQGRSRGRGPKGAVPERAEAPIATLGPGATRESNVNEIAALVRSLLADGHCDGALSALYRGGISLLAQSDGLLVSLDSTEGQCIRQLEVAPIPEERRELCIELARARQRTVYAQLAADAANVEVLCERLEQCFRGAR